MRPIIAGTDTEYGLLIEGRGAGEQVEDATAFVRHYPGPAFVGWDVRWESPRADLRGFRLDHLAFDPEDAAFDAGKTHAEPHVVRADRVLPNGARFYNDHGHPEYATPECLSVDDLALHDAAGELAMLRTARAYEEATGLRTKVYKNNTDFHGASYGTHESYLVPRALGFERLFRAVTPVLVARTLLCGAGKVGAEHHGRCDYQASQRADFFAEPANAETLFRRPVFNTRDESHADPGEWIRLHVISGDANMIAASTKRRVGLVKLALALEEAGAAPPWRLRDPVEAFRLVSREPDGDPRLDLEGGSWTTAPDLLHAVLDAAEKRLDLPDDLTAVVAECRELLGARGTDRFRRSVDWAAKRWLLRSFADSEGIRWGSPELQSYDLAYHDPDPEEGLHAALVEMGEVEPNPSGLAEALVIPPPGTRAMARGVAVTKFHDRMEAASWRTVTLDGRTYELPPEAEYPAALAGATTVEEWAANLPKAGGVG